jgi:hypothetical protein
LRFGHGAGDVGIRAMILIEGEGRNTRNLVP